MDLKAHMSKARTRLLLKSAFYGTLVVTTPSFITRSPHIPTAGTNMLKVWYNADFIADLSVERLMGLIAHEISHIALMHGFRRQGRDPKLWNIAADHVINLELLQQGFELPTGGHHDPQFRGMSTEQVYDLLAESMPPGNKPQPGDDEGDGQGGGQGGGQPDPDGQPQPGKPSAAGMGVPGVGADLIEGDDLEDPDGAAAAQQEVKARVAQAITAGRMAGTMPAGMERMLHDVIYPPVPWQEVLRPYMQSLIAADESWSRRNRRFGDVYLPARSSPSIGRIVIIGDTSGSITDKDLQLIGGSVMSIAEDTNPEAIHMLWADTEVAGRQEFARGDDIELKPCGGGGTDMRVPLAEAAELEADVCVLITDGYTPWPDTPPEFPVITVCTSSAPVPFGEVVRV